MSEPAMIHEATILELQAAIADGQLTAARLTRWGGEK